MNTIGILIPSHITEATRIAHLKECIGSLADQIYVVDVHLSISFETALLRSVFQRMIEKYYKDVEFLHIHEQETKKSQFRHIEFLYGEIKDKYDWVMFCDDDDSYHPTRVAEFNCAIDSIKGDASIVGITEMKKISDDDTWYEYWCSCVQKHILGTFIDKLYKIDLTFLEYKCCDVLFANYLRFSHNIRYLGNPGLTLYNYRQSDTSFTGNVRTQNENIKSKITNLNDFGTFIKVWGKAMQEQKEEICNGIYLWVLVFPTIEFHDLLTDVIGPNAQFIDKLDKNLVQSFKERYNYIRNICLNMYDTNRNKN